MVNRKLFFQPTFKSPSGYKEPTFQSNIPMKGTGQPTATTTVISGSGKGNSSNNNKNKGSKMQVKDVIGAIGVATEIINDPGVQKVASVIVDTIKSPNSGGPSSGRSTNGGSGVGFLSNSPNPAETKLNTGIPLTLLEKNYTSVEENVCAPLHLTCVLFTLPISSSIINSWYTLINTRDYQSRVQETVNWAVDINTKFSATNITNAMNALYKALQIYYFYSSVDSYASLPTNQNDGMYAIRSEFTYDTYYRLAEVKRLLARTPLPPNMNQMCRFLFANYFSGETPNSPIIKLVPFARNSATKLTSDSYLDGVISDLSNPTYIDVWNTLARAVKTWMPGTTDQIFDAPLLPEFNRDFITIFNNVPSSNGIVGKTYSPNAANNATNFTYLSWNNNLDGAAVAFTDCYNTTTSTFTNGMVSIPQSSGYSRWSYYVVSGVKGWYAERNYPFLQRSRLDTYTSDGTTESVAHRFGSDMVINVSGQMISTTCVNLVDWMLSSANIKGSDVQRSIRSNPGRKRRSKSK